jgi:PTS system nitrogen regulatory IIA component
MTVPESCNEDHLNLLAQVAELFSDPDLLKELREAASPSVLLQLLSSSQHSKH